MNRPPIVALSGPDNVGKSTQLRILARRCLTEARSAGALHEHDPRWADIMSGGMASWWFTTATLAELADVLASSYLARHTALTAEGIQLIDRGVPMLEASLAATLSVRLSLSDDDAHHEALRLLQFYQADLRACEERELGIMLLHSTDPEDSTARSLARESTASDTYCRYQLHLSRQVLRLVHDGRFAQTVLAEQGSIMSVQDKLRDTTRLLGIKTPAANLSTATIVALGGMSESGKSSAAQWLQRRHGFTRLKIGYLLDQAAARHGISDVYALDETTQAELLVDSLDRFLAAQYYSDRIIIESLHRHDATLALQTLLGMALTTVYVDTAESLRRERGAAGRADITERDHIKRARGAHRVSHIADLVISNDASALHLQHHLDRLARSLRWPTAAPQLRPVTALGIPQRLTQHVDQLVGELTAAAGVDLIAVTGSGGRGKYQHGWSDLDVLIIAEAESLTVVRDAAARLRDEMAPVKLGLTLVTRQECQAGALTPRLIHTLRQLGTGDLGVQWCTPDLRLPYPPADDDAVTSLSDGALTAIELRRQLIRRSCDARSMYKLAALLAKVMLRLTYQDPADDKAALQAFAEKSLADFDLGILHSARTNHMHAKTLAEAILGAWLDTLSTCGSSR